MLSTAKLAHHGDPEAIAEIICQELQHLGIGNLDNENLKNGGVDVGRIEVEVAIDDSVLDLQIHTDSALDKEKLLALLRSEFQNLHIESVAKYRIHCWRNDEEMHEHRLLWTEQFMLEPLKSSLSQTLELESENLGSPDIRSQEILLPEKRSPEPQLSKHSVLQLAIEQISPNNPKAKQNLLENELAKQKIIDSAINLSPSSNADGSKNNAAVIHDNYWHLLLVGLSIMLLGLGIGAFVRAISIKSSVESSSLPVPINAPVANSPTKPADKSSADLKIDTRSTSTASVSPTPNLSTAPEVITTPSSNSSESPLSLSSSKSKEDEALITLEKFNRIQKGMTIEQVERVFGVSGKVIAENNSNDIVGKVYSWKNPQGSNAIIEFKDGQVVAKAQAGL
jgi:hypothetical protein